MTTTTLSLDPDSPALAPGQDTLLLGLILGFLADRLLWPGLGGLGFPLWIGLLGLAAGFVARRSRLPWFRTVAGWAALAFAAASLMAWRAEAFLQAALWAVLLGAASMVMMRAWDIRLWESRPSDHVLALLMVPARALCGMFPLLACARLPRGDSSRRLAALGRGLLLATPLLLLFAALFSSADAAFARFTDSLLGLAPDLPVHLVLTFVFAWLAAGLLSGVPANGLNRMLPALPRPRLGWEETAVLMGLLGVLFVLFVVLQLGYLFGGRQAIEGISGLSLAEYARRGFFELLAAAALSLAVLLVVGAVTQARRLFTPLAALLILCVGIMLASALQRLALYIGAFGLTLDRINALAVMLWLGLTLGLFAATVLRDRPRRFASGAFLTGIAAVFALVLVNPPALVAKVNVARAAAGADVDAAYLLELGADAVPVLTQRLPALPAGARCQVADALLQLWGPGSASLERQGLEDWRTWNAARAKARSAVSEGRAKLGVAAAGCGDSTGNPALSPD